MFGITGWKNAGKTTLAERLVAEFVRRGWRVATVKHAHHAADIDKPGTDSFRHRAAGATEVALVTGARYAIVREQEEATLAEVLARLAPADLVLVEGFKRDRHPKIEVRGAECRADGDAGAQHRRHRGRCRAGRPGTAVVPARRCCRHRRLHRRAAGLSFTACAGEYAGGHVARAVDAELARLADDRTARSRAV